MPATAAIPQEVAKCFTKAGDYGRYVISSGPYMIMGEDKLDDSSCSAMKPLAGYNPDKGMTFSVTFPYLEIGVLAQSPQRRDRE